MRFYENQGPYTAIAHDDIPGWFVHVLVSGNFNEPAKYASYSIDKNIV